MQINFSVDGVKYEWTSKIYALKNIVFTFDWIVDKQCRIIFEVLKERGLKKIKNKRTLKC